MRLGSFGKMLPVAAVSTIAAAVLAGGLVASGAAAAKQAPVHQLINTAELVTAKATIVSVDSAQRKLTIKTPEGLTRVVKAGPQVQNFAELKAGEVVNVAFYQSLATDIRGPGAGQPSTTTVDLATRAPKGALPAGTMVETTVFTFEVVGIEPRNKELLLADSSGDIQVVYLQDPKLQAMLPKIKLGDKYDIAITDALAVSVTPAK